MLSQAELRIRVGSTANASDAYNANNLVAAFYDAAASLDEKGVSSEGRVAVLNPRQYYELIQAIGGTGSGAYLVNRDTQGDALQSGQGIMEIAGIRIYKSMNIPRSSPTYGTKFGTGSATNPGVTDPGNTGSFVGESGRCPWSGAGANAVAGIQNEYGQASNFANSCGLIFQREGAGCTSIGPQVQVTSGDVSVVYQGDVMLGRLAMGADYLNLLPRGAVRWNRTSLLHSDSKFFAHEGSFGVLFLLLLCLSTLRPPNWMLLMKYLPLWDRLLSPH